jgi:vacuolar-type H+-ATPase catalytic subunit A/Vma1
LARKGAKTQRINEVETREEIEALAKKLVHVAYQIHVELGPGLFESVYEEVFV